MTVGRLPDNAARTGAAHLFRASSLLATSLLATVRWSWDVSLDKQGVRVRIQPRAASCAQSYNDSHSSSRPDPAPYAFTNDNWIRLDGRIRAAYAGAGMCGAGQHNTLGGATIDRNQWTRLPNAAGSSRHDIPWAKIAAA